MPAQLYTIGYATKPIDTFIAQLKQHQIHAVADVRSVPFSQRFYDYHQDAIAASLKAAGIYYVYLGEELGPRSKDSEHYDQCGQVQFDRLMASKLFQQGIARLQTGLNKQMNIALMCAEKDPATCHRSLLIGYFLNHLFTDLNADNADVNEVLHIGHDGSLESQTQLEARIEAMHQGEGDLFLSAQEKAELAYQQQLKLTSYVNEGFANRVAK